MECVAGHREHAILRISFWIKLFFILLEVWLAVAFGICTHRDRRNVGAVLEWVIALIFSFYIFSFTIDLFPAVSTAHGGRFPRRQSLVMGAGPRVSKERHLEQGGGSDPSMSETRHGGLTQGHF